MGIFLTPTGMTALLTAAAGIALFGLSDVLPAIFPPEILRLIGLGVTCAAAAPIYALTESPLIAGGFLLTGLALIVLLHLVLTRRGRSNP
jgi:hypothetical protein